MPITIVNYPVKTANLSSIPTKQHINNGVTHTLHGMPSKTGHADGATTFSIGRKIYTETTDNNIKSLEELYKTQKSLCSYNTGRQLTSTCLRGGKPFNISTADQHIQNKKNNAIGRGTMPKNPDSQGHINLSFQTSKSSNYNTINTAVRRCRNSGCVAPAKKGAKKN